MPTLYVVATPIGNLQDFSPRGVETLRSVALIAAEDTRVTMKLCQVFDIRTPLTSCHQHNEAGKGEQLAERMRTENIDIALTTDAGTPCVSDPGYLLVRACLDRGIPVLPVPGCCAGVAALSVSGFDAREWAFYGFLPREKKALSGKLDDIRRAGVPVFVLYESPHRIVELTQVIAEKWPRCALCVCSDLTKKFERIYRGPAPEVLAALRANPSVEKGEYCLAVDISMLPPVEPSAPRPEAAAFMLARMLDGASIREAADAAAEAGYPRNEVYRARLKIEDMFEDE